MASHYDALVIGSGAGGSATAYALGLAGHRVRILEKGGHLPEDGSTLDPAIVVRGRFNSTEEWRLANGQTFRPEEHFNVGGKTRWYGAALLRASPEEFRAEPQLGLPAWPLAYDAFRPFYEEAERILGVRPFGDEPQLAAFARSFARDGWKASTLNLGLLPEIRLHPQAATHWDGYAVPGGLKADALYRFLQPLRDIDLVELETEARVQALLPDPTDPRRVAGVRLADGREYLAERVFLAAGAMHSPRLLQAYLESTALAATLPAARHVGRNFKRHILTAVIGFGLARKQDVLCKTSLFLHERFPHGSVQPLGGWADVEAVRVMLDPWYSRPMRDLVGRRAYGFFLQTEDASHPDNRVYQAPDGTPVLDYSLSRMPQLAEEHRQLVGAFSSSLRRAWLWPVRQTIGLQGTAHCAGTLAASETDAAGVVDPQGRVHGMHNLYVSDGSALPRLGRMNPALGIYAWGLHVARGVIRQHAARTPQTEGGEPSGGT